MITICRRCQTKTKSVTELYCFMHSNSQLAHNADFGWCFEDAWELGLGDITSDERAVNGSGPC
ncbi:rpoE leader peptide RseD [Klebsiella pneumoniae]|uniref:RpoE leader peptide RseD n=2 Tax=Klebsiella pneumoniae TaxID=573 RepID=A0A939SW16_KLEPN|nr:rpoE leader peptide RseD [Klebsiella pneumoniae]